MIEIVSVHGFGGFPEIGASVMSSVIVAVQPESTISELGRQFLESQAKGPRLTWPRHIVQDPGSVCKSAGPVQDPAVDRGEDHPAAIGAAREVTQHRGSRLAAGPRSFGDNIVNEARPSDRRCSRTGRSAYQAIAAPQCGILDNITALRSEGRKTLVL